MGSELILHASDPEDEPLSSQRAVTLSIVEKIIEEELHTDDIVEGAIERVRAAFSDATPPILMLPPTRTGAIHAKCTPNWVYGVDRAADFPLRSGVNFSADALKRGTGVDEHALPNWMRRKHALQSERIVKARWKRGIETAGEEKKKPVARRKKKPLRGGDPPPREGDVISRA